MSLKVPNNDLAKWLLGAMLAGLIMLIGIVWGQLNARLERIELAQAKGEERSALIQLQYGKIDVVLFRLDAIDARLKALGK